MRKKTLLLFLLATSVIMTGWRRKKSQEKGFDQYPYNCCRDHGPGEPPLQKLSLPRHPKKQLRQPMYLPAFPALPR